LTAAIVLARTGVHTTVLEAQPTIGGGARSAELTLPGFLHDVCSAVHPLAVSSPAFRSMPLKQHGLEWIYSPAPLTHPLDDGSAVVLHRSVEATADGLGADGPAWHRACDWLARNWNDLTEDILAPPLHLPKHPFLLARFGALSARSASSAARAHFQTERARALFAGNAAHSFLPLETLVSGAFGWILVLSGHGAGWPIARGGSQKIADALVSYLGELGGSVSPNTQVQSLNELREADLMLFDVTPRQLLEIAGDRLPPAYRRKLARYRYGPGVFKMDWALNGPIPWKAAECRLSATVHVGGTLDEIAASERGPWEGRMEERPFVLVAQPSVFDASRAPEGMHTAWAYCHVPNGSTADVSDRIEAQIERFAPGFHARIIGRSGMNTALLAEHNANLQGGDINGGAATLRQLVARPASSLYRTPVRGMYLCSASTPPCGGVHGMCGYHAARAALHDLRRQ